MNRRSVLAGVGSALALPSSGCLSGALRSDSEGTARDTTTALPKSPADYPLGTGDLEEFDPTGTDGTIDVGSREGVDDAFRPHDVVVWNEAPHPEVVVEILDTRSRTKPLAQAVEIPGDAALEVSLLEPSRYLVVVRLPASGTEQTLRVPCWLFDCNGSATRVGLFDEGAIRATVGSSLAGCPSPNC